MYNEDPASLRLFTLLRPIVLQLSIEEKKRLNDWFEDYKKNWFEKADKLLAKSIDIQEEKLSQFLDYIRASENFSKSTYKDLCHFNSRSTLISTTDHFCLALTSAILYGNVKELFGNHINLNLNPGSELHNTFSLVFPDYKNKNLVEDEKIKNEITTSAASSASPILPNILIKRKNILYYPNTLENPAFIIISKKRIPRNLKRPRNLL